MDVDGMEPKGKSRGGQLRKGTFSIRSGGYGHFGRAWAKGAEAQEKEQAHVTAMTQAEARVKETD